MTPKSIGACGCRSGPSANCRSLTSGGSYLAAGVGQGIAGYRADLIVIDDPVRSRADADSETVRDSTFAWFNADLRTRLRPGGRILLIMTRWNFDDLAGRPSSLASQLVELRLHIVSEVHFHDFRLPPWRSAPRPVLRRPLE